MGIEEIIGALFVVAVALVAIIYRAMWGPESETVYADRAIFKSVGGKYLGYARFSDSNRFLKMKLRQLEDVGVHNGHNLQIIVNDFVCDEIVWPGILLKYRKSYDHLLTEPGFAKGARIVIKKGDQIVLSGVFGEKP